MTHQPAYLLVAWVLFWAYTRSDLFSSGYLHPELGYMVGEVDYFEDTFEATREELGEVFNRFVREESTISLVRELVTGFETFLQAGPEALHPEVTIRENWTWDTSRSSTDVLLLLCCAMLNSIDWFTIFLSYLTNNA